MKLHVLAYTMISIVGNSALLMPLAAHAQSSEEEELARSYGDKNFVSIATGTRQPLARAPAVASVITAAEIAAMGATDISDVLESVPGLHIERFNSEYTPIQVVRGIHSAVNSRVLFLKNGISMNTLMIGGPGNEPGALPLEHIARIEVIRGPGSALYGADAYSTVINIITKSKADIQGTQLGTRLGSFKSKDIWLQSSGALEKVHVTGFLRFGQTDGSKQTISADAQTARDKIFGTHASLAPGSLNLGYDAVDADLELAYQHWLLRVGYILRDNVGNGAGVASSLDPLGNTRHERYSGDLSWTDKQIAPGWGASATLSYFGVIQKVLEHHRLAPPGTRLPTGLFPDGQIGHPDTSERQLRLSGYLSYSGFEKHQQKLGIGHEDLDMYYTATIKNYLFNANGVPVPNGGIADYSTLQPFLLPHRRKLSYIYLQDEWQLGNDLTLTSGIRHDRYSDFGNTTNPRLALVWKINYAWTSKLLYGSAFRAPSFNEAYGTNNPVFRGNPDLRPETIKTWEAAFNWQIRSDTKVDVNFFQYRMQDIINIVSNPNGSGSIYLNQGEQKGHGLELEFSTDAVKNWRFQANYAYQQSTNQNTGQDAGYAPHHQLYAHANWRFQPNWQVGAQINHVAGRKRTPGDNRPAIADYTTCDMNLRHSRGPWQFAVGVRNLFNADVREPSLAPGAIPNDLPMPGRNGYMQLAYTF